MRDKLKIYMAVQCHDYELRHCFQVSSLLQQLRCNRVNFYMDVAFLEGTKNIYRVPGMKLAKPYPFELRWHATDRETFARRGLTRNEQLLRARAWGADWVWLGDCDHVYPSFFLLGLWKFLHRNPKESRCISASRKLHTRPEETDALVLDARGYWDVPHAYARAFECGFRYKCERNVAGGAMQIASARSLDRIGWRYVDPAKCLDKHLFKACQMARSDLQFRHALGGSCLVDLPLQIHLDHRRDKEEGKRHIVGLQR